MSKPGINTVLIAIPMLLVTILLVTAMLAGGSAGGTLASGRSVMTHSDSISLSSTFTADTATIETAGRKIIVRPTSLLVDGITVATIDENVADVQVSVERGVITFMADGTAVKTSLR